MIKLRLNQLPDVREGHFLKGLIPGEFIGSGAMSPKKPGFRTHSHEGATGDDRHVHEDCEVFVILQGKAIMELNDERHPMVTGDVFIVEPGEDHHLVADQEDPCINLWFHAGPDRHPDQV